jgi:N-acyl-D-amino-acid deacylase
VQEGGNEAWFQRLHDPALRARLVLEIGRSPTLVSPDGADRIRILKLRNPDLRGLVGKTLGEVARSRGVTPAEAAIDLVAADRSRVGVAYFVMSEDNVRQLIRQPWMTFASDAESAATDNTRTGDSTHPRGFGAFARVLGSYVREGRTITLADAVRRLAALPAENLGIADRGKLQPGFFADIVVFDPATIADRATFEKPRLYAVGMRDVFVNGQLVLADGEHTGARPGRFVRKQQPQAQPQSRTKKTTGETHR